MSRELNSPFASLHSTRHSFTRFGTIRLARAAGWPRGFASSQAFWRWRRASWRSHGAMPRSISASPSSLAASPSTRWRRRDGMGGCRKEDGGRWGFGGSRGDLHFFVGSCGSSRKWETKVPLSELSSSSGIMSCTSRHHTLTRNAMHSLCFDVVFLSRRIQGSAAGRQARRHLASDARSPSPPLRLWGQPILTRFCAKRRCLSEWWR